MVVTLSDKCEHKLMLYRQEEKQEIKQLNEKIEELNDHIKSLNNNKLSMRAQVKKVFLI
jgi:TolA-binding protein